MTAGAALAGCGGGSAVDTQSSTVRLTEQNGSGQSGTAVFTSLGEEQTRIVLELTSPNVVPQPAHVHSGSCDDLGDVVVPLEDVEDGRSETEAEISVEGLMDEGLVIHAHKSEAAFEVSVACAPIESPGDGSGY